MKRLVTIVVGLSALAIQATGPTNTPPKATMQLVPAATTNSANHAISIVVDGRTNIVSSLAALNEVVASLPSGTRLTYFAGYAQFYIPVGTNRVDLRTFGDQCRSNGVHFVDIVPDF